MLATSVNATVSHDINLGNLGNPFVWQKRLFVLGALGAPVWVSMLQVP
jgi:hypothetical protein